MDHPTISVPPERRYLRLVVSSNRARRWIPSVLVASRPLRYSASARQAIDLTQREARRLNHSYIGTEHILLGLTAEDTNPAVAVLQSLRIDVASVRRQVEDIIGIGQRLADSAVLPVTPRTTASLRLARDEALRAGCDRIGAEHILLGLIREREGIAGQVLTRMGASLSRVRARRPDRP